MREFEIFAFITKDFSGAFQELLSVTMPASLPLQLLKISPKTLFVLKAFKIKHSLKIVLLGIKQREGIIGINDVSLPVGDYSGLFRLCYALGASPPRLAL